mgnify:FL=1
MTIRNISEYSDTEYDVCIVGSGPAGITLASELLDSDKKVCVLESGGETKTPHADSLKRVINLGEVKIRKESRERIFGGTSTTWGGGSSPLDGVDMILRDFMVHPSGWPFEVDFLSPYYKRCEKYGFPSLKMFENENFKDVRDVCDFSLNSDVLEEKIFISVDPPWNFGHKFKHIFLNKNIDLYTDATAYNLRLAEQDAGKGQSVVGLDVVSSHGKKINVRAKQYVVACGGIESTRLLMVSKDISKIEGLRNNLGRYLMNHPKNSYGILKLNKPISSLPMYFGFLKNGVAGYAGLRIKQNSQIVQRILIHL